MSKKFEIVFVPLGYDKKYQISVKGHSFNVMFRSLDTYDNIDDLEYEFFDDFAYSHENYSFLLKELSKLVSGSVLEVGAGTGNLTKNLLVNPNISKLDIIEPDENLINKFKQKFTIPIKKADGIKYKVKVKYDYIISSFVYHHIPDSDKFKFLENQYSHIKNRGKIIIGDTFILPYLNKQERDNSFRLYYNSRIKNMKNDFFKMLMKICLDKSLKRTDEWKTSSEFLINQLKIVGFNNINVKDIGNQTYGGDKIIIAEKYIELSY